MKTLILLSMGLVIGTMVRAQSPVPDPDTLKPARHIPYPTNPSDDVNYTKDHVKITPEQIPAAVKQTLESAPIYEGWQKGRIFRHKNNSQYLIEVTKGDTTKTFRLDQLGRPVNE
jgi:hypothetical protein